jgi:protein NrfD
MNEVVIQRFTAHLDMGHHVWEWMVPVYLFLGGVTAGVMVLSAIVGWGQKPGEGSRWLRWAPLAAPVIISIGMGCLFLDLSNKLRVYRFFLAFQPMSPMSWGSWVLLGGYPAAAALGLAGMTRAELAVLLERLPFGSVAEQIERLRAWLASQLTSLRWANLALGMVLGIYTGVLLSTLGARALWSSALLGPLFLASGLSAGAAFMMLFPLSHREHSLLLRWDMGAIVAELGLIGLYLVGLSSGGHGAREAVALLLGGDFTAPFWALVVVLGLAVPLIMEGAELRRGLRPVAITSVLVLVGSLSLRWILVVAGQV